MIRLALFLVLLVSTSAALGQALNDAQISAASRGADGVLTHSVQSPRQRAATEIRVLLPDEFDNARKYRVLCLLPVEAGRGTRYGDGLAEAKRIDLHNRHQLICIAPTFADLPWYADHPTDKAIQQESYLLRDVIPLIDRQYPVVAGASGRMLLGFSKSGWGAFSLLLRNPNTFSSAAAWDAPLVMKESGKYGSGPIFGTQENFAQYQLTHLIATHGRDLPTATRLIHLGYGNFREHHQAFDALLESNEVPRVYRDGPKRKHTWGSGWVDEAVELLMAPVPDNTKDKP